MKITKIEKTDDIFTVTKSPNLIQKLFGLKDKSYRYKANGNVYFYFQDVNVYVDQNGKVLGPFNKMTTILDNWRRKF
jgi:hypothetical protein